MTGSADILLRRYTDADAEAAAQVFFDAVHTGAQDHYTPAQRMAWAGPAPAPDLWRAKLAPMTVFVAEQSGRVTGFMSMDADGLLDLAFVAPDVAGTGVGWRLYLRIEAAARTFGVSRLHADISLAARAFFERQGWHVVRRQRIERAGVTLTNFRMEKSLVPR